MSHDTTYLQLVSHVLNQGVLKQNRTGVPTIGVFGCNMRFDLKDGTIPLLTTKKMHLKSIIHELLWYLKAGDNTKYLTENGVTIWDEWAAQDGSLGPVYGFQWRNWKKYNFVPAHITGYEYVPEEYTVESIDQIAKLIRCLKTDPDNRRMIVSAWNVADLGYMALPPCHYAFQCYTTPLSLSDRIYFAGLEGIEVDGLPLNDLERAFNDANVPTRKLSLKLNQRSCDIGLGVPFNIVQYSILLRMLCEVVNMIPGEFIWDGADVHVYTNHIDQLREQMTRTPYQSPTFKFARRITDIDDFKFEDFIIQGYQSHPTIKMDVAK